MPPKITQAGQPCRHCGAPVVKRTHQKPPKPTKAYYFAWWFACPQCKALYMVEDAKRFFAAPATLSGDLFAAEPVYDKGQPACEIDETERATDELPPWGSCGPECSACR